MPGDGEANPPATLIHADDVYKPRKRTLPVPLVPTPPLASEPISAPLVSDP
jgi:hypothetical protein